MSGGDAASSVRPKRCDGPDDQTLRVAQGERQRYFGDYPPDFFDVIIVEECDRGGANGESRWCNILGYFSLAVQLGLTKRQRSKQVAGRCCDHDLPPLLRSHSSEPRAFRPTELKGRRRIRWSH